MASTRRSRLWKGALVIGSAIASLAAAEVLLRLLPTRFRENLRRERYIAQRPIMHLEFCEPDPDPVLGWRNISGKSGVFSAPEFSTTIRFNSLGLRGPEVPPRKFGRRRIAVLGDSLTVGWGVEENETFASRIARSRPEWDVLNLGVSGYGTRSEWGLLKRLGPVLKPTDVVVAFYLNDPSESFINFVLNRSLQPRPPARAPYLLALLQRASRPRHPDDSTPYYHRTDPRYEKAAAYYLHQIQVWCRENKARLLVLYLPAKDEIAEPQAVGYRKGLLGFGAREGIAVLDATEALAARRGSYYPLDDHLTPIGHEVVAEVLAEGLDRLK